MSIKVADVVVMTDPNIPGIIEDIRRFDDGMTVYKVRAMDGTLYAREQQDFTAADQATTTSFRNDLKTLAAVDCLAPSLMPVSTSDVDGAVFTRGMVDAEIRNTGRAPANSPAGGPLPLILGVNASVNMVA